jgi:tetratricopeptide (TPR) repeat protein
MLKPRVLLWHHVRYHTEQTKWSPFFTSPAQTDALLKPLQEPPGKYHVAIQGYRESSSKYTKINLLAWLSLFITVISCLSNQLAFGVTPSDNGISILRAQALEAEGNAEYDRAESLYQKALTAARQSGSKTKVVEFLSRIVQVRIENDKLSHIDALVQEAIQIAQSLKNSAASDSTLSVWMNDMADAIYSKGEHTKRDDIKEHCMERYLDVKFAMVDVWDPQLMCKANLLTSHLTSEGKYLEAVPYVERTTAYLERTQPQEINRIGWQYFVLATNYSAANDAAKARFTFEKSMQLQAKIGCSQGYEAPAAKELGTLALEQDDLEAARRLFNQAAALDKSAMREVAQDECGLGFVEQRASNFEAASRHFRASLNCAAHCPRDKTEPINLVSLDSIVVVASEHLAQVLELSHKDQTLIQSLQGEAKKVRAQRSEWASKNPDPERYFLTWWRLPYHIEIIPTRLAPS